MAISEETRLDEQTVSGVLVAALRVIAGGYWNVGRETGEMVTVNEYAEGALRAAGLWEG